MKQITGGVTAAKGFMAASTAAGIKYKDRKDMAMIFSEVPCVAAGTFTTNIVKAAPVKWDQNVVYNQANAQAVVVNAGIANACTGEEGMGYCKATAEKVAELLKVPAEQVLVASTGVIGKQLPIDRICSGIDTMVPALDGSLDSGHNAALAIMTTDTHEKEIAVEFELDGKTVTIGGMCKGSGMIHPNMCTMLGFLTTDIAISKELLQEALRENVTIQIFKDGVACEYSEEEASKILAEPEVRILVDMKAGEAEALAWGCDLTYDYVKINADYRS